MGMLLLGTVLITLSSQVKLPSLLALGFVAMALARRWGGTFKAFLIASGSLTAVSLAVMAVIGWASGLGFGWLFTLGTANVVRSWMSPPTLLALGTGQVGILLGPRRPHHRGAGADPWHRRVPDRGGGHLAAARGAARTAASGRRARRRARRHRAAVPGRAAVVPAVGDHPAGVLGHHAGDSAPRPSSSPWSSASSARRPTATGSRCSRSCSRRWRAPSSCCILIALTYYRLPWRKLPDPGDVPPPQPEVVEPALPAPQTAKPDAYAESP